MQMQRQILSGPNITANLYRICLTNMKHALPQMQYRFAVIYETPSKSFVFAIHPWCCGALWIKIGVLVIFFLFNPLKYVRYPQILMTTVLTCSSSFFP